MISRMKKSATSVSLELASFNEDFDEYSLAAWILTGHQIRGNVSRLQNRQGMKLGRWNDAELQSLRAMLSAAIQQLCSLQELIDWPFNGDTPSDVRRSRGTMFETTLAHADGVFQMAKRCLAERGAAK